MIIMGMTTVIMIFSDDHNDDNDKVLPGQMQAALVLVEAFPLSSSFHNHISPRLNSSKVFTGTERLPA